MYQPNSTEDIIRKTIKALKDNGMIKQTKTGGYAKTEDLLRRYPVLKQETNDPRVQKLTNVLERLEQDEYYYDVIPMIYFESMPILDVALDLNVSTKTVIRQKKKMVESIRDYMFPEDYLDELFN